MRISLVSSEGDAPGAGDSSRGRTGDSGGAANEVWSKESNVEALFRREPVDLELTRGESKLVDVGFLSSKELFEPVLE